LVGRRMKVRPSAVVFLAVVTAVLSTRATLALRPGPVQPIPPLQPIPPPHPPPPPARRVGPPSRSDRSVLRHLPQRSRKDCWSDARETRSEPCSRGRAGLGKGAGQAAGRNDAATRHAAAGAIEYRRAGVVPGNFHRQRGARQTESRPLSLASPESR